MPDAYKLLYQGQLAATVGTLYTVPGGGVLSAIVRHISVVNNDTVNRTFVLYRQGTAATNIVTPPAIVVPAGGMAEWDGAMAFATTETIRGTGSVASMLSVTICGDEVS